VKLLPALNPGADVGSEHYLVVDATEEVGVFRIVESHATERAALLAMKVLQRHADKYGHGARYEVVKR